MITVKNKIAESIVKKLMRRNRPVTLSSVSEHLNDVAGVRVICSFVDDIYRVRDIFLKQDDIAING